MLCVAKCSQISTYPLLHFCKFTPPLLPPIQRSYVQQTNVFATHKTSGTTLTPLGPNKYPIIVLLLTLAKLDFWTGKS